MTTPRKHAELIKKWAEDESLVIQFKDKDGKWYDDTFPTWEDCYEFRVKPHKNAEVIKIWADDTTVKIQVEVEGVFVDSCLHDVINYPNETFRIKPDENDNEKKSI